MPTTAGEGEIRAAYRRLARVRHPDRNGGDESAMAALNEAYRVLSDPRLRAAYDARGATSAVPPASAPGSASRPAMPSRQATAGVTDLSPARFPWKLALIAAAVGAVVVLAGAALYEPPGPAPPDQILHVGSCVAVAERERTVGEVRCDDDARFAVSAIVPAGDGCPAGTGPYRDRLRGDTACVVPYAADG